MSRVKIILVFSVILEISAVNEIPNVKILLILIRDDLKLNDGYQNPVEEISVGRQLRLHRREMKSDLQRVHHGP